MARTPLQFSLEDSPFLEDLDFLEEQINTYNILKVGVDDFCPLAIFWRNADGQIIAGLSGYKAGIDWS